MRRSISFLVSSSSGVGVVREAGFELAGFSISLFAASADVEMTDVTALVNAAAIRTSSMTESERLAFCRTSSVLASEISSAAGRFSASEMSIKFDKLLIIAAKSNEKIPRLIAHHQKLNLGN